MYKLDQAVGQAWSRNLGDWDGQLI